MQELERFFGANIIFSTRTEAPIGNLKNFLITQKNSAKYFEASEFHIYQNQKFKKKLYERPKLDDIRAIVYNIRTTTPIKGGIKNILKALRISITTKKGEKGLKEKFVDCLEGIFYEGEEEENYWRVGGRWYLVSRKYTFEIYKEYIKVLKTSLIDKENCPLRHTWPLLSTRIIPNQKIGVSLST